MAYSKLYLGYLLGLTCALTPKLLLPLCPFKANLLHGCSAQSGLSESEQAEEALADVFACQGSAKEGL